MMWQVLIKVFKRPVYVAIGLITSILVFVFATWLANIQLLLSILPDPSITGMDKIKLLWNLTGSIATNFTILAATNTILIALLFGVNFALIIYYISRRINLVKKSGFVTSILGLLSGVFGIGCAACGSLVLGNFLAFFGASTLAALLPLAGQEFGIIGVFLLVVSVYMITKRIQDPLLCQVEL